jgi:hypothetical protein
MTSKERVMKAVNRKQPDRAPVFATITAQVADALTEKLGMPKSPPLDSLLSTRISHMEVLTKLGNDCVGIASCAPKAFPTKTLKDGTIVNDWGMKFKPVGLSRFPENHGCDSPPCIVLQSKTLGGKPVGLHTTSS